jgi:hypothetical protein
LLRLGRPGRCAECAATIGIREGSEFYGRMPARSGGRWRDRLTYAAEAVTVNGFPTQSILEGEELLKGERRKQRTGAYVRVDGANVAAKRLRRSRWERGTH